MLLVPIMTGKTLKKNTTDPYIIVLEDDGKINSHFRKI